MKESCAATFEWFDIVQTSAPKSKTKLVFTQVDHIEQDEREDKITKIKGEFKRLFEEKQNDVKQHLQRSTSDANKKLYQIHIDNYQYIIDQLANDNMPEPTIPRISCKTDFLRSVDLVVDLMLLFAKNLNQRSLSPVDLDLFTEIGTLGLKKDMILEDDIAAVNEHPNTGTQVTETTETIEGENWDEVKVFEDQEPRHGMGEKLRQQYITLTDVRTIFHPIWKKHLDRQGWFLFLDKTFF